MKRLEWIAVESSAVQAVAYADGELFVRWTGGKACVYSIVPEHKFQELLAVDSIGRYVNAEIKPYHDYRAL